MTDKEKYKAAFMCLLTDYAGDIREDSFCEVCPLRDTDNRTCSLALDLERDGDSCCEEIFKWYLKLVTKK